MKRVLVLAHVDVPASGRATPGSGARPYEVALALARAGHRVTLAAPNAGSIARLPGLEVVPSSDEGVVDGYDACILPVAWFRGRRDRPRGLVVGDVADPMLLSYAIREGATAAGCLDFEGRVHALARCLLEADVLLHSGPSGRLYLMGMLSILGRIAPGHADPGEDVLDVPFAAPRQEAGPPPCPDPDPSLAAGGPSLLWSSGAYPFFDASRALSVFESCAQGNGEISFLVAGGLNPRAHPGDKATSDEFFGRIQSSPLRERIRSVPWLPYAERSRVYAASTLALVFTKPGIEDLLSWRNRVVDAMWGGVPVVLDGDDDLTRMAVAAGAAIRVERTVEAGVEAVRALLADGVRRRSMAEAGRALTGGPLSWDASVRPLVKRIRSGGSGPGLSPRAVTPLRLEPRRWGTALHRLRVSMRLRGSSGILSYLAKRATGG